MGWMGKLGCLWGLSLVAACGGEPPPKTSTTNGTVGETVRVGIANDGSVTFDGKKVDDADLTNRTRAGTRAQPNLRFIVDGEREASFQNVIVAVERLRAGGATNITFGAILASSSQSGQVGTAPPGGAAKGVATGPTPEPHASIPPNTKWDCPFPPLTERRGKEDANVLVRVHVDSDGKPLSVDVLQDPGAGFATAAQKCALDKAYQAARDVNGQPIRATTFPFYVHFVTK
jgi:hypothetical protein